jgi:hypothetical protein
VAAVAVKELQHRIVRDENIGMAIPVIARNRNPKSFARSIESNLRGNLRKVPIAVIVIDERDDRLKEVGMAIGTVILTVFTAPHIDQIPLQIPKNHQMSRSSFSRSTRAAE